MHLEDLLEEAMFQDSTLGWNITGPRQVIREMTREQILAYRDAYYVPARMTIVVAGKIVPGLMGMIEKTFGRVRSRATRQDVAFVPFVPPAKITKPVAFQKKETEQVQLAMAFYGLPVGHKDLPTVGLLSTILGGSMSSRLFIEIRERRGLCYSIRASHDTLEDTGVFSITAGLDKKRIDEAVQEIHKQLRRITQELVTPQELRRAKDHIRGRLMLAFEDSETQAEWYGRQWVFNGSLETPDERLKKIERVKASDIRTLAASLFVPDRMAGAIIGPLRDVKDATRIMNSSAK